MAEKTSCSRCNRAIDSWAKICPFCNQNQAQPVSQPAMVPREVAAYTPPADRSLRKTGLMLGGVVVLLVLSFVVGMVINKDDAPRRAPETLEDQAADHRRETTALLRADTPLVPVNGPAGIAQPYTSAPAATAPGMPPGAEERTDATAVSSVEYAQIARRAEAEKKRATLADPRAITGDPYATRTASNRSSSVPRSGSVPAERRGGSRTRPVPQHQPLPQIDGAGHARLTLLIGSDGRVQRIDIEQPLERNTAALVSAVQSWRFKPATENGEPISAPYSVEIKYN